MVFAGRDEEAQGRVPQLLPQRDRRDVVARGGADPGVLIKGQIEEQNSKEKKRMVFLKII